MNTYVLDGKDMRDRSAAFEIITQVMHFPAWFGRNLDALADCLSEMKKDSAVLFVNTSALKKNLGEYGNGLLNCFRDTAKEIGFQYREIE